MTKSFKALLIFIVISALLVTASVSFKTAQISAQTDAIKYIFENSTKGSAVGTITYSVEDPGNVSVYWMEDDEKLILDDKDFTPITTTTVTDTDEVFTYEFKNAYSAIPEDADAVGLYNGNTLVAEYNIPESKQPDYGDEEYRFALMSDVHFNRYYDDDLNDWSIKAWDEALNFVDDIDVERNFVVGDLSNQGEESAYEKFNEGAAKYPDILIYSCMGNHDVSWTGGYAEKIARFKKMINKNKNKDKNVTDIAPNNLDFVYTENKDVFIFFSQQMAVYSPKRKIVLDNQLNWLEKIMNKYANRNVYLFFHTFFADYNGDITTAVGNLKNPGGYTYDLAYSYGADDEKRFRSILNKYNNVTMFNGHSHWAFDQQKYNPKLNIGNIKKDETGAGIVHVPSVSAPRTIERDAKERDENYGVRSEGTIATKFAKGTLYYGTDFKNQKYLAYAIYYRADGKKTNPVPTLKLAREKITKVGKVKKYAKKKYKVKIKYKKIAEASRYQIQYSTSKKFKKKVKSKTTKATSYTIKKLKRKTRYYIRVRAYGYQFGERVNGAWSKTRKVRKK